MIDNDELGNRMKAYEQASTARKAFKGQPIIVRLDGKNFHTFTRGLERPYDRALSNIMVHTAAALVEEFHPNIAYTQSDEITLVFLSTPESKSQLIFDGRFQKIESLTAAAASVEFNALVREHLKVKAHLKPKFDSRAFVVPNVQEAYHALLWRQNDATKNAISMAAQSMFSHKSLQGMSGPEMQERMFSEKGVNFNDYPFFFKRGTFVKREQVERYLSEEELARIPEKHRPTGPVMRTQIVQKDFWLSKLENPAATIFA